MKHKILKSLTLSGVIFLLSFLRVEASVNYLYNLQQHDKNSLLEHLIFTQKRTDKLKLYLDMHGAAHLNFTNGFDDGSFELRELRLGAHGQITSWLSYRYRQKLNRSNNGSVNMDNIPSSIDFAYLYLNLSSKWGLCLGRQGAAYGGTEYDLNPIEVYEYSDFTNNTEAFMTGISCSYLVTPVQELTFQILNNRNARSTEEMYGVELKDAKFPLVYSLNWCGNFADKYIPRWSVSYIQEPLSKKMYFMTLGNELCTSKLRGYIDFSYSQEGLDRTGIVSRLINLKDKEKSLYTLVSSRYLSTVLKFKYQCSSRWSVFAKGMYEEAHLVDSLNESSYSLLAGKYQTSYGYLTGLEYYPLEDSNLCFFLTYVGRSYRYKNSTDDMLSEIGIKNYDTHRVSLGFIYHMPLL